MPTIYLPTAAIGNGRLLATLGGAGEIMAAFYPHVDFAQNIRELLPFVYAGAPGQGRLIWTWESVFEQNQRYLPDTNILVTRLTGADPALEITLTDFVPASQPDHPNTALVRTVTVTNRSGSRFIGSFGHYFNMHLGEVIGKQAVRYDYERKHFLQYFRDVAITVGGTEPDHIRCGKSGHDDGRSARYDIADGQLNGQPEDIGAVDFAHLFDLDLPPGRSRTITVIIGFARNLQGAELALEYLEDLGAESLLKRTEEHWRRHLEQAVPVEVDEDLQQAYRRSLLMMAILQDAATGSFVAAPEFDPKYEYCGGYGYCWPRDASEAAQTLHDAGYHDALNRLVAWYRHAQRPDGLWGQRHWAEGAIAASWSLREGFRQLDQSAAALVSICRCTLAEGPDQQHRLAHNFGTIKAAAEALHARVDGRGYHSPGCDLWETFEGTFAYTNAAFAVALKAAADCARLAGDLSSAEKWAAAGERLAEATVALYNGTYFPRGLYNGGETDDTIDSATLGLVDPFTVLDLSDPEQRAMAVSNLETIESALARQTEHGPAIIRYQGESYLGGAAGCVNTLWASLVKLRIAVAARDDEPEQARQMVASALTGIRTCLAHATVVGCLPELMAAPQFAYWAAPHGWASGLLVKCVLWYNRWLQQDN
jgi:oligosaccharide amylase